MRSDLAGGENCVEITAIRPSKIFFEKFSAMANFAAIRTYTRKGALAPFNSRKFEMQSIKLGDCARDSSGGKAKRGVEATITVPRRSTTEGTQGPTLPTVGLSRWDTISLFVPVSRETWRKLVSAGRAPAAIRLTERCTMYSNAEVHRWLEDPRAYGADR